MRDDVERSVGDAINEYSIRNWADALVARLSLTATQQDVDSALSHLPNFAALPRIDPHMATFPDLDPLPYFGKEFADSLRAIGWLGRDQPFRTGTTSPAVFLGLQELLKNPFQPVHFMGFHTCEICQFEGAKGTKNLFVPSRGVLLVCPELILHYTNVHGYAPPQVFCDAVLECPDTRSQAYRRLFLENGGRRMI